MMKHGKILFYNEHSGDGIVITQDRKKLKFTIQDWDDFDTMPTLGLEVIFDLQDETPANLTTVIKDGINPEEIAEKSAEISTQVEVEQAYQDQTTAIRDLTDKDFTTQKYKNDSLTRAEKELSVLLNDSSSTLKLLNKKISLSSDILTSMNTYLDYITKQIRKREGYKKVDGRLDYNLCSRFLWTTYNNLMDIDRHIITFRIKSISDDLKLMGQLKEDFYKKTTYPLTAFEDIFLSSQTEYRAVKNLTQQTVEKLNFLHNKEHAIDTQKKICQQNIDKCIDKEKLRSLNRELRILNGTYVDIVHMMAKLKEIHKINTKRLLEFENTYKEDFFKVFKAQTKRYQSGMLNILNAQAYLLDFLLWKEAKTSNAILKHFKSLDIDMELNTKTYLKYYLSTLDEGKSSKLAKELFSLYKHLEEIQKEYILVIVSSAHDAMEYESSIKQAYKNYAVKSFINELQCIKWASANTVKAIIIEEVLQTTNAKRFLEYYHKHIFSKPKIILIGNNPNENSKEYTINKVVPPNISAKALSKEITILLNS